MAPLLVGLFEPDPELLDEPNEELPELDSDDPLLEDDEEEP